MTASFDIHKAEATLLKEHSFPSALCRFLEYGRGSLLGSPVMHRPCREQLISSHWQEC